MACVAAVSGCSASGAVDAPGGEARAFVSYAVTLMQTHSLRRDSIDWTDFRARVFEAADGATTIPEALPSMALALSLLGDNHSWLRLPNGLFLPYPRTVNCVARAVTTPNLPADIGYVSVPEYVGSSDASASYVAVIQEALRSQDGDSLSGWIIDLRRNGGGNMWPMLAAVSPLLQGVVGHFLDPAGQWTTWRVEGNSAWNGPARVATVANPVTLANADPRVAVWTNGYVASSGEAVTIAFRKRPSTRSFGEPTCGLSTGVAGFPLTGGYTLGITGVVMADRDSVLFGGPVVPDETIVGDSALVARTVEWLRSGS